VCRTSKENSFEPGNIVNPIQVWYYLIQI